ncbi:MAG: aldehyde dehydrogenase family protein [Acidobacteriota bacterium]|jgi:acyl-CoA reductase-like NAD-dependent aldehyde dehydrogenase|nr:aldehyde dehydrogenase family protein [Acidobacteriota bacterium]
MQVINPATEEISEIKETPLASIPKQLAQAEEAQRLWRALGAAERAAILLPLADSLTENKAVFARLIADDMGKPLASGMGEIRRTAGGIEYLCKMAPEWLAPEITDAGREAGYIEYAPLGVVGVIMPWNGPVWLSTVGLLSSLLSGNGVLYKPSENSLRTGIALAGEFQRLLGLPEGLLQLVVGGKSHGKAVVESDVAMVALVGSTAAGKDIMKACAAGLKRVSLELGGLDAAIVLKDVDVQSAAKKIVRINCTNSGQVCCSIKRVYVERQVYSEFLHEAVAEAQKIRVGNPLEDVDMGPLAGAFQLEKVEAAVADAVQKGARVLTGGGRLERKGFFYPPTIVTDVTNDMTLMHSEPFGPVLPVAPVDDWAEAVRLANSTRYGLTGSIWTKDMELARAIASQLDVGVVGFNDHGVPPLGAPWGGARESGIGRARYKGGLRDLCNVKFVRIPAI